VEFFRRWRKAALLLALVAVAGGAAYYWYALRLLTAPADLARFLPASDSPMVYLDASALRKAGILDLLAGRRPTEAEYASFVSDSRFDYRRDLDAVLASLSENGNYFVVSGRFDWGALTRYAQSHGGSCSNDLCRMPASQPGKQISYYPLRRNLMALAVSSDGWAASLISPYKRAAARQYPAEPVWVALSGGAIKKDGLPAGTRVFASALEGAEELSLALGRGGAGYQALLRVTCRTPEEAARLTGQLAKATDTLRAYITREKQTPNPNDLSGVLTSGQFHQEDNRVIGAWPMPDALLKSLTEGSL
jgi:hypothetical protein